MALGTLEFFINALTEILFHRWLLQLRTSKGAEMKSIHVSVSSCQLPTELRPSQKNHCLRGVRDVPEV